MSNRILVSGLVIGKDPKLNVCSACNYDLSWLVHNPSILLCLDKIIVTPETRDMIKKSFYPGAQKTLGAGIKIIYDYLELNNLIEVKAVSSVINTSQINSIYKTITDECKKLEKTYPKQIRRGNNKEVPGQIFIRKEEYCAPYLWTLYASLVLAERWKANKLYSEREFTYLSYKYNAMTTRHSRAISQYGAFDEVIRTKIPKLELIPGLLIHPKRCHGCKHIDRCNKNPLNKLETNIKQYMELRSYDEIIQLREVLNKITKYHEKDNDLSQKEIVEYFREEERKVRKKIYTVFPKMERWANMITMLSLPIIVAGINLKSPSITATGTGIGSMATVANEYIKILRARYRWLGFKFDKDSGR